MCGLPLVNLLKPRGHVGLPVPVDLLKFGIELKKNVFHVPDNGHIHFHILLDAGRVYVDVDNLAVLGELIELAGHPVVKAGANGNHQVRFNHSHV